MIETIEAIRREVVVAATQQRAFEVFTGEMTSWWPADHHIGSAPIQEIVIEPREGGRCYTRHQDGTESSTGYVRAWEPYDRFVFTWQIGADWKYDPKLLTTVQLRFIAEGPERTRVELEHRDLENYGTEAQRMRELFSQPGAWDATLAGFASALPRAPR
ncbi:MAG: SRPBCC family protein [Solirubrobacteraceae bacterium]